MGGKGKGGEGKGRDGRGRDERGGEGMAEGGWVGEGKGWEKEEGTEGGNS